MVNIYTGFYLVLSKPVFACSKLTSETLEQGMKYSVFLFSYFILIEINLFFFFEIYTFSLMINIQLEFNQQKLFFLFSFS